MCVYTHVHAYTMSCMWRAEDNLLYQFSFYHMSFLSHLPGLFFWPLEPLAFTRKEREVISLPPAVASPALV